MKPDYNDPEYLNKVCRYCPEAATSKINFKDGTSVLTCPEHTKQYVAHEAVDCVTPYPGDGQ